VHEGNRGTKEQGEHPMEKIAKSPSAAFGELASWQHSGKPNWGGATQEREQEVKRRRRK